MANRLRGEVDFELDGKTYTVRLDINALIEAEGLGVDINDTAGLQKIGAMRAILWAGLRAKHPELDLMAVGQLMTDLGLPATAELVGAALKSAFPDATEPAAKNPPTPSRGAGKHS